MKNKDIQKVINQINDGDVDSAASRLAVLKRSWAYGTPNGKKLYKAHEEVTIGSPEKAVHILEDLEFDMKNSDPIMINLHRLGGDERGVEASTVEAFEGRYQAAKGANKREATANLAEKLGVSVSSFSVFFSEVR